MSKPNDLQMNMLSHAAKTDHGSIFPLAASITDRGRAQKELKALLRRGFVAETETTDTACSWRHDGDIHFGLTITDAGKAAINLGHDDSMGGEGAAAAPTTSTAQRAPRSTSKIANVLALLGRTQGATLAELVEATGWLPHTTRAALTGLKKKGHVLEKTKRDEITCYHIAGER